jgi:hypothetical protein
MYRVKPNKTKTIELRKSGKSANVSRVYFLESLNNLSAINIYHVNLNGAEKLGGIHANDGANRSIGNRSNPKLFAKIPAHAVALLKTSFRRMTIEIMNPSR